MAVRFKGVEAAFWPVGAPERRLMVPQPPPPVMTLAGRRYRLADVVRGRQKTLAVYFESNR